jgi:hypothetical protein
MSEVKVVIRRIFAGVAVLILLSNVASLRAQELATENEARAMLDRALAALKSNEGKALSQFNDPDSKEFHDRDLYVVCFNMSDGKITAYSGPALLGVDIRTLSLNDDPVGQRTYDAIHNSPQESIVTMDYKFPKPGKTEPVPKQFIETRVGNQASTNKAQCGSALI